MLASIYWNKYRYCGPPCKTRGEYGERIEYGYDRGDGRIAVFDATFGWQYECPVEYKSTYWIRVV